jgi:DNA invertase Pin-like site-specific DNA recombinase
VARIGYARVSTGDQHPEAQEDKLRAAGCQIIYTDRGVSGKHARRPEWDKCLARLEPGDTLVTTKLDRIGRSVINLAGVARLLQERDADLIVLDQPIDTTTPHGRLTYNVLAAMAEFERDLIIGRTRDGQAVVRRRGNLRRSLGGPPVLGFRVGGGDDWELDPGQAGWLAEAAARVLAGEPVEAVHAALPPMADSTGRAVTAKMLRAALTRPASAGLITVDGVTGSAGIAGPLDEHTFNRLAVLFGSRKRGRRAEDGRFWFGPLLRCGVCGNQLTGETVRNRRTGEPTDYYACKNPHKALGVPRPCRGCSVPAEDVHTLLQDVVMVWAQTDEARAAAARSPETDTRRAEVEAEVTDAQERLADLWDKREAGYFGRHPARFAVLEEKIIAQIKTGEAELDELDRVDAEPGIPPVLDWDDLTPGEKVRAVSEAVKTPIVVQPGNGGGAALSAVDRIDLIPA